MIDGHHGRAEDSARVRCTHAAAQVWLARDRRADRRARDLEHGARRWRGGRGGAAARHRARPHAPRYRGDVRERRVRGARGAGDRGPARQGLPGLEGAAAQRELRGDHQGVRGESQAPRHRSPRLLPPALARQRAARGDVRRVRGAARAGQDPQLGRVELRRRRPHRSARARRPRQDRVQPGPLPPRRARDRASRDPAVRKPTPSPVVAYSPIRQRRRFPKSPVLDAVAQRLAATPRQVALAFLARKSFAIPKSSSAEHVEELAHEVELDNAAVAAIEAAFPLAPWRGLPSI